MDTIGAEQKRFQSLLAEPKETPGETPGKTPGKPVDLIFQVLLAESPLSPLTST